MDLKFEEKIKKGKSKLLKIIFGRTTMLIVALLVQLVILLFFLFRLTEYIYYYYGIGIAISFLMLLHIVNSESDSSYKLAWAIPVAMFPVFGALFYLFVHIQAGRKMVEVRLREVFFDTAEYMKQDPFVLNELEAQDGQIRRFTEYMNHIGPFPMCNHSGVRYYPVGDEWYPDFIARLKAAEEFIFIEFFIVSFGKMWDEIYEILKEKARQGVEVRFMYDGTCTFFRLPHDFPKQLESNGIKCRVFFPIKPALSTYQNYRDHRKIVVIDGKYAYTGGVNLADEYINEIERFGHWKDTAVELTGKVVDSFTVLFLQLWNIQNAKTEPVDAYIHRASVPSAGYVMGFMDSPFDQENVGENVYLEILNTATRYVHIMTPYLILDEKMQSALIYAVKRGIDVKIIMPHITDKPYAYLLARNYYEKLIPHGVKIYEYTPGFVHAKEFISDDKKSVVGSINLDYRSLYLNFESAVYMYDSPAVADVERDFEETLKKCQEITIEDCKQYGQIKRLIGRAMWLIGPLM